ncbi:MAG: hypothetical protein M0R06_06340, partial [Sphaerochaeta sp.]|nr:hypothetical protein [Sphaerochaeta sp.]
LWRGGIGGEVKNPRAAAALARHYERAGLGSVDVSQFPEDIRPLAEAFIKGSGHRPANQSQVAFWIKTLREMQGQGIDAKTVGEAITKMRLEGLTIKTPASVAAIAADILAVKKAPGKNKNRMLDWG